MANTRRLADYSEQASHECRCRAPHGTHGNVCQRGGSPIGKEIFEDWPASADKGLCQLVGSSSKDCISEHLSEAQLSVWVGSAESVGAIDVCLTHCRSLSTEEVDRSTGFPVGHEGCVEAWIFLEPEHKFIDSNCPGNIFDNTNLPV